MGRTVRIVVAEDDENIRSLVSNALAPLRCEVIVTNDGVDAWAAIERQRPDLLVTDIMMPSLDGLELVTRLRRDPELESLPVVVISVLDRREPKVRRLEEMNGVVVVPKPFSVRGFQRVVADLISAPAPDSPQP
jgi:two-component system sensor histidine kinase and response regulator WspE